MVFSSGFSQRDCTREVVRGLPFPRSVANISKLSARHAACELHLLLINLYKHLSIKIGIL